MGGTSNGASSQQSTRSAESCTGRQFRGEARYAVATETVGSYLCQVVTGSPKLVWTDARASVGAEASVYEGKGGPAAESLLRQWRCCLQLQLGAS
jgi:hypothetical protein